LSRLVDLVVRRCRDETTMSWLLSGGAVVLDPVVSRVAGGGRGGPGVSPSNQVPRRLLGPAGTAPPTACCRLGAAQDAEACSSAVGFSLAEGHLRVFHCGSRGSSDAALGRGGRGSGLGGGGFSCLGAAGGGRLVVWSGGGSSRPRFSRKGAAGAARPHLPVPFELRRAGDPTRGRSPGCAGWGDFALAGARAGSPSPPRPMLSALYGL